jgi:FkbM family methyltransferase
VKHWPSKKKFLRHRNAGNRPGHVASELRQLSNRIHDWITAEDVRQEYIEKILHLTSLQYELSSARLARPYFPLNNNWALTFLDTGEPFFVDTSDRDISPWLIIGGHWEPNVARSLLAFAAPGMTVLDVGANMGYYTVRLAKKLGTAGRILAVEPNPAILPFLKENLKINGLVEISKIFPVALGDERGEGLLKFADGEMGGGSLVDQRDSSNETRVPIEKIDDIVPSDWGVDLIKIDAEGYEKKILDGSREVLRRSRNCAVMIELRLESWEKFSSLEDLAVVCGEDKHIFGVEETGSLKPLLASEVRPYLLSKRRPTGFHENYFFVMPETLARERIGDLISAPT